MTVILKYLRYVKSFECRMEFSVCTVTLVYLEAVTAFTIIRYSESLLYPVERKNVRYSTLMVPNSAISFELSNMIYDHGSSFSCYPHGFMYLSDVIKQPTIAGDING